MGKKRDVKYDLAYIKYQEGLSLSQVAKDIGVSRQGLFKAFKLRNFELRTQNQRDFQIYDGKKFTLRNNGYYGLSTGERTLMHRYVWENEKGKIPDGWDIHHLNEIKGDCRIENLECLPKADHTRKYSPHNNQYTKGRKRASH